MYTNKNFKKYVKDVTFLVTTGKTAVDLYSQKLYDHLQKYGVKGVFTKIPHQDLSATSLKEIKFLFNFAKFIKDTKDIKTEILHISSNIASAYIPFIRRNKYIITVHDVIPYILPEHKGNSLIRYLEKKNIRKADHIIVDSKNTKEDVIKHLQIPTEKITVVLLGVDHEIFKPRKQKMFDFPYILYVGLEEPRKNFEIAIKAFYKLKKQKEFNDLKFVKVGAAGKKELRDITLNLIKKLGIVKDMIFTGYVQERDLPYYFSSASLFVFPSTYEGFGLPPLEAMACGCPVVVSDIPPLLEVTGDAGMIFNPYNADNLANKLREVLTNNVLRERMINEGLKRAKMFSWEKAAKETIKIYRSI